MTRLLRVPLVAAGAATAGCTLAGLAAPALGLAVAAPVAVVATALAALSTDRPRRVLWWSVAVASFAAAARLFIVPPDLGLAADPRVDALRAALAAPLRALVPEPESALLLGFVLGERAGIPRDVRDAFAITGTAHLIAISGTNMTIVAAAVSVALRHRAPPIIVAVASVLAIAAYTVLVGPSASVLRAALMAAVSALALALGRRGAAANGLGAAATGMLLLEPRALEDVGFLLSVAATAGLIAWQRPIAERLARLPRLLADGIAATLAASVPTIPILAAVFGRVSLISPVANLAAVPLFAPIMAFGAATAAVGAAAPVAAAPLALAAYLFTTALRRLVEIAALVPFAAVTVPSGTATGVLCAGIGAIAWRSVPPAIASLGSLRGLAAPAVPLAWPLVPRSPIVAGLLGVLVFAGGATATALLPRAAGFRLYALDVGQGDAYLLESAGHYALVDGGPDGALLMRRLGEVLPPWQRRIDLVVLTHEHTDHGAGLLTLLERYDVGLALEPARMADLPFTRTWHDALERRRVPHRAVSAGAAVRLGDVTFSVLAPDERPVAFTSLVLRGATASSSALFMGDATDDAIADLLLDPERLAARVYVPPHHGADTPYARQLVAAVRAEIAVISVGAMNRYGHPTPSTLAALGVLPVYRTDRYGTVDVALDAEPLAVHTAKADLPPGGGGPLPRASPAR